MYRTEEPQVGRRWIVLSILVVGLIFFYCFWQMLDINRYSQPQHKIGAGVEYLVDPESVLTLDDIRLKSGLPWQTERTDLLSFGIQSDTYWFRIHLPQLSNLQFSLLELDYPLLDDLKIWLYTGDRQLGSYVLGDSLPFAARSLALENFVVPLQQTQDPLTAYVRVHTSGAIKMPLYVWNADSYLVYHGEHNLFTGGFFGLLAALALSNFFFFLTTRTLSFLVYGCYVFCLCLTLMTLNGIGYKYLWPDSIWLQAKSILLFAPATIFFALVFSRHLLPIKQHSLTMDWVVKALAALFLISIPLGLALPYTLMVKVFLVLTLVVVPFLCALGLWLCLRGVVIARLYTLGWITLLVSAVMVSLDNLNMFNLAIRTQYLLMLGASIEAVLLAMVLAINYDQQRRTLFEAQEQSLDRERQLREAQDQAQEELEYKVQERTLELEIALRELSETNRELEERNTMDALTGIRNRRYFDRKYQAEVRRSRREQSSLTVAMIDIDHFKQLNDTYGHLVGDECIRAVAQVLREQLRRPADDVCRFGGEEFAVLLPNTDIEGACALLESIREKLENMAIPTPAGEIKLTISIGVATAIIAFDANDMLLLEQADKALYGAKQAGRNQLCQYNELAEANQE
ncbi:diguanylate cyclase [Aliiglaciecola sp. CAU 1673]|uniref:sensor domain-containing diguanylate cyclase n=1 Tax=Aliiglaciecola sp. CAU 1673 TaxID=3032595 RepID=UPI0023DCCE84|nr:diguanylate cyclase [Aliiglaciecola sp. CAU 1673]MDF2178738.1 diguanylate cyclase [Aliiglaciecola sp. CAU 1673]